MSLCGLSIALSLVFGFLLLAIAAQIYYFLWWRNKRTTAHSDIESMGQGNYPKGLFRWGCWKVPRTVHADANASANVAKDTEGKGHEEKDFVVMSSCEEGVESELMRLHNLAGPPRFLFTIKEETKEDLESEDGKSLRGSRARSLSDVAVAIETPYLTPLASSPLNCPLENQGFNPLFESSVRPSSPPPKFKFMRDAEEKYRRLIIEETNRKSLKKNHGSVNEFGVKDSSIATIETEQKEFQQYLPPQFPSGSSQVLPLASSPTSTTFIPLEKASSMVH